MKRPIVLSATVLAASCAFILPSSPAQNQPEQQAGQVQGQVLQDTQQKGKEAAARQDNDAARREDGSDRMFAKHAASDNAYEIQLAQYVDQQAKNPQVKELAQQMIQDHQQAKQQLEQIAKGMNVQLSTDLEPWQQAKLDAMRQKHGEHLERAFAFGEVGDHHTAILNFQYEAQRGQNAQLKNFAQQTIPALEKHLRLAEDASAQWVSEPRTAGERIQGSKGSTDANSQTPGILRNGVNNNGINR